MFTTVPYGARPPKCDLWLNVGTRNDDGVLVSLADAIALGTLERSESQLNYIQAEKRQVREDIMAKAKGMVAGDTRILSENDGIVTWLRKI